MPTFGSRSTAMLATCVPPLRTVAYEAINYVDFAVIEALREDERQAQMFREGKSKLDGVTQRSRHQANDDGLSEAFDFVPWPTELHGVSVWEDRVRFAYVAGIIRGVAEAHGIALRMGLDWDNDTSTYNHSFVDMPHVELVSIGPPR